MTQDERWMANWKAVMDFMTVNKRRPSKFVDSERGLRNWWKHQQKLVNAGGGSRRGWRSLRNYLSWERSIDELISTFETLYNC